VKNVFLTVQMFKQSREEKRNIDFVLNLLQLYFHL